MSSAELHRARESAASWERLAEGYRAQNRGLREENERLRPALERLVWLMENAESETPEQVCMQDWEDAQTAGRAALAGGGK